jgi:hypothetical protein
MVDEAPRNIHAQAKPIHADRAVTIGSVTRYTAVSDLPETTLLTQWPHKRDFHELGIALALHIRRAKMFSPGRFGETLRSSREDDVASGLAEEQGVEDDGDDREYRLVLLVSLVLSR